MKTTITSADLASMAARVPDVAASRKLSLFDAIYLNVPEVTIDGESVCIDEAIEVAGLTRAPFVSLDIWTYLIRRSCSDKFGRNIPEDSPSADNLIRLVKSAAKHNGENERLGLRWAAHGLNYEWSATADWRRKLAFNLARADFEDQQESSHRENARKSDIDVLVTLLTGSPEFRAAQPTKRHSVGFAVVSISMYEAEEDVIR